MPPNTFGNKITRFRVGDWQLDLNQNTLSCDDIQEKLPNKSAALLLMLVKAQGKIVTIESLTEQIWDGNKWTAKRGIINNISKLRAVLGQGQSNDYIENLPKLGYRLLVDVEPLAQKEPPCQTKNSRNGKITSKVFNSFIGATSFFVSLLTLHLLTSMHPADHADIKSEKVEKLLVMIGDEHPASISDSGNELVFSRKVGDYAHIYLLNLNDMLSNPKRIISKPGLNLSPKFIDNDKIAYLYSDGHSFCKVMVYSRLTGIEQALANCHPQKSMLQYDKDRQILAYNKQDEENTIEFFDLSDNFSPRAVFDKKNTGERQMVVSTSSFVLF